MEDIELLAPAGSYDALKAAINAGCDAVYIGGAKFGARAYANNFNNEELKDAIKLSHRYGVKVYVTINTLIYDHELKQALDYIYFLYINDVDAIIIQDLGLLRMVKQYYPNLELHASTQMTIHNLEAIKFLEKNGIDRVVLARENSIDEIRYFKNQIKADLEVFVHGALCISYSGQCLMSGLIGGRSGNRGKCAQPCRKKYKLDKGYKTNEKNQYFLSTKDLNTIERIPELIEAGVKSFKIEGRMKKPEYVYTVVKAYRHVIDMYVKEGKINVTRSELNKIAQMFNRNFTKGFLFNEQSKDIVNLEENKHQGVSIGKVLSCNNQKVKIRLNNTLALGDGIFFKKDHVGIKVSKIIKDHHKVNHAENGDVILIDSPKNVINNQSVYKTYDHNLMKETKRHIELIDRKVNITGYAYFNVSRKPILVIQDDIGNQIEVDFDFIIEQSKEQPVSKHQLELQLNKLGNTPFTFKELIINTDADIFIPKSVINKLRRKAIEELTVKRESLYNRTAKKPVFKYTENQRQYKEGNNKNLKPSLVVHVRTKEQLESAISLGIKEIYIDDELYDIDSNHLTSIMYRVTKRINHSAEELAEKNNYVIGQLGNLNTIKDLKCSTKVSNYSLNITNSYAIDFLSEQGIDYITLSYELNKDHYRELMRQSKSNLEIIIFGYQEAMITKYSLIDTMTNDSNKTLLKDEKNEKFPVYLDGNQNTHILNSKCLVMVDELDELQKIGYKRFRVELTIESKEESNKILEAYKDYVYNKNKNKLQKLVKHYKKQRIYTRGYFSKNLV